MTKFSKTKIFGEKSDTVSRFCKLLNKCLAYWKVDSHICFCSQATAISFFFLIEVYEENSASYY